MESPCYRTCCKRDKLYFIWTLFDWHFSKKFLSCGKWLISVANVPQLEVEFLRFEFGLAADFLQPLVPMFIYLCRFLEGNSRLVAVKNIVTSLHVRD